MPTVKVFNMAGEVTGEVNLSEAIFGVEPNELAIHTAVKSHLANLRQGTQSALTRGEVSGGGIKPLRQKGTGNARQGSIRAPHYTHGGIAFAPKPRDYSITLNKKLKRLALKSALSAKAADGAIIVVDKIAMDAIKTKDFKKFLDAVGADGKNLVVMPEVSDTVIRSARNIQGVKTTISTILSTYDIMNAKKLVIDQTALEKIEEVYA